MRWTIPLIHKITRHAVTGVVSSHFKTALCLYRILNALHYQIPRDVSLVSLRNDSREFTAYPEISHPDDPPIFISDAIWGLSLISLIENPDHAPAPFGEHPSLDNSATIDIPLTRRTQPIIVVGSINIDTYLKNGPAAQHRKIHPHHLLRHLCRGKRV